MSQYILWKSNVFFFQKNVVEMQCASGESHGNWENTMSSLCNVGVEEEFGQFLDWH